MDINDSAYIDEIINLLSQLDYIKSSDIPNIDLYMDQVTTFMDKNLKRSKRSESDKVLTKTMINNYAKNNLLPPPQRKKYSKDHLLMLIFIYYFKNVLSINDTQKILSHLSSQYFNSDKDVNLEYIYNEVFQLEKKQIEFIEKDLQNSFGLAQETFQNIDIDKDAKDKLQLFSFICSISFDIYIKKQIIETIIDNVYKTPEGEDKK